MILISQLNQLKSNSKYLISLSKSSTNQTTHQNQAKSISIILYGINRNQNQQNQGINQNEKRNEKDLNQKDLNEKDLYPNQETNQETNQNQNQNQEEEEDLNQIEWLAIQEECPHLGQSLINAEIQIEDSNIIAICPWHNYDFDLRTGESSSGIKACIIRTIIKDIHGIRYLFFDEIEDDCQPDEENQYKLISILPISQRFAIPEPDQTDLMNSMPNQTPTSLLSWASLILKTSNPIQKIQFTRHSISLFKSNQLSISNSSSTSNHSNDELPPSQPSRERSLNTLESHHSKFTKNGKSGNLKNRIKLLHSLANIELWAIDLTWDLMCRFGKVKINEKDLPREFFIDFCKVAEDEAKHFTILREAIQRLGSDWGELPVHDGLWQSARDTSHSLISRICIIHLVHEARGLDVNPTQIKRVKAAGDIETAKVLEIIHADEITHVAAGHKWLNYICKESNPKIDPVEVFRKEVKLHFMGKLKPPFNVEDRSKAGLDPSFYENLD
ncbi:hypothetical protein DFH28DRAFT_1122721 [Melampsora americana]|nr:hypothetical protein DFH28DRAFT_1122721 [Melampsora americana]